MFVYLITNIINGKCYVGQTVNSLEFRWRQHQRQEGCPYLHAAIKKYGVENFSIEVICEPPTIELMNEIEEEYIERYNTLSPNGYNLTKGGVAPKHHEDTRKKMSLSHIGRPHPNTNTWATGKRKPRRSYTGFNNPNCRLKPGQPQQIRDLYSTNKYTQTELAERFSITQSR